MPVPRRLDRRPPEQDLTRINERIGVPEVRLIDEQGQQVGVMKTGDALRFARERDLDLVEVAPQARPPVARVLDYSKYKYEQAQKQKQARKHQQQITIREIKFRPKIAQHDYDTKKGHVERFLMSKYKVKVTIMFRGREVSHPERGVAILDRLAEELTELGVVEQSPTLDGRNMAMLLAPSKAVLNGQIGPRGSVHGDAASDTTAAAADGASGARPADEDADDAHAEDVASPTPLADGRADGEPEPAAQAPSNGAEGDAAAAGEPEASTESGAEPEASTEAAAEAEPEVSNEAAAEPDTKPAKAPGRRSRAKSPAA